MQMHTSILRQCSTDAIRDQNIVIGMVDYRSRIATWFHLNCLDAAILGEPGFNIVLAPQIISVGGNIHVAGLAEQWTYSPEPQDDITQVTPLVVDGVMSLYSRQNVFALNARTGEELWRRPDRHTGCRLWELHPFLESLWHFNVAELT